MDKYTYDNSQLYDRLSFEVVRNPYEQIFDLTVILNQAGREPKLHLVARTKAGRWMRNALRLHSDNLDALIGALQRVKAGPLGRMALDAADRSDHG